MMEVNPEYHRTPDIDRNRENTHQRPYHKAASETQEWHIRARTSNAFPGKTTSRKHPRASTIMTTRNLHLPDLEIRAADAETAQTCVFYRPH